MTSALFLLFSATLASAELVTGALQPSSVRISQDQLPLTIMLGKIRGTLEASPLDTAHPEGSSAFAQLTFTSDDTTKQGRSAELIVEAEYGEIVSVTGNGVESDEQDGKHLVLVSGIREKRLRRILVEMKLDGESGEGLNTLKFLMRAEDEEETDESAPPPEQTSISKTVALSWPVESCGRNYHSALKAIGEAGGNTLRDEWRDARRPLKSVSRRWHFRPSVPRRSRRGSAEQNAKAISRNREREILIDTGKIIRSGFRRELSSRGRYGWALTKTAADLKGYFSQDYLPTICTGVEGFASYYEGKLAPLGKRSLRMSALTRDAEILARTRVVDFIESVRNLPGGHPAWGGSGLESLKKSISSGDDMKALIVRLLESARAEPDAIAEIVKAETSYDALVRLDRIGLSKAGISPRKRRRNLQQVLARIEAAVRLVAYRSQYDAFWLSFYGSLEDIRDAHAEHCVCGS
ncbi:MAG: hypothetical protein KTR19_00255 [Hyphomicrobiales bacterium]|nr:hypothetical protein [Hyphomicrobiales bacterium]